MKLRIRSLVVAVLTVSVPASAQQKDIPIRRLSAPLVSTISFLVPTVRVSELPDGRVLARDNAGRQLLLFDSLLAGSKLLADADGKSGTFYSPHPTGFASPPLRFPGDTMLLIDLSAPGFLAVTPDGRLGTTISHPISADLQASNDKDGDSGAFDNLGRFIYRAYRPRRIPKYGEKQSTSSRDTIAIVRADLDRRKVDTIAHYSVSFVPGIDIALDSATGRRSASQVINPFPMGPDGWAVLSTGTVGIVRQQDYHVDWIAQDGKQSKTAKLPFDWKVITEAEKIARIDSMKRAIDSLKTARPSYGLARFTRRGADGSAIGTDTVRATFSFVALDQMPDYYPPLREGAVKADRDGNLWILPSTSASARGGLLYDVVSEKDGLHERVQLPSGCVIAGFGAKRAVFLACMGDRRWVLQRHRVER